MDGELALVLSFAFTHTRNKEEEEILAVHVKKYPCLFDKTDKGCKEKDCVGNAWEAVASSLEMRKELTSI